MTGRFARLYHLYGVRLTSEWPLICPATSGSWLAEIRLVRGRPSSFSAATREARTLADEARWSRGVRLSGGGTYLQWRKRFEFLISADGRRVAARPLYTESPEAFQTYLLGQVLSFALVNQGFEPLHATVVAIDGTAIAFLGDSGYGKSSLGAAFLRAGHRLVTDDLLMLSEREVDWFAHPGPPSIKLFPKIAGHLLGPVDHATPLAWNTRKSIIPLDEHQRSPRAVPLKAIYVLVAPSRGGRMTNVKIRRLSWRSACVALLRNTFNTAVVDPARLERQLAFAARVAAALPVKQISYPRTLSALPVVRGAILGDCARQVRTCCS